VRELPGFAVRGHGDGDIDGGSELADDSTIEKGISSIDPLAGPLGRLAAYKTEIASV